MQPVSHGGGSDRATEDSQGGQSAVFGASVMDGASAMIARIVEYLQAGFAYAKSALDATASVVRGVVDGIIETARSLLGLQSGTAPPALNLFSEAGVEDGLITGSLLDGDGGLAGSLYSAVDLVNSLALSGLGETLETVIILTDTTLDPVIHLVDGTTQELVGTVHGTTDHLLYTTDRLVGAVTGTLDRLTGGLTQPVGALAHGTIGKVDKLTDAVLPTAADTASKVLGSVEGGLDRITGTINEISPNIISRLHPEFAAASEKSGNGLAGVVTGLSENILAETPFPDLGGTPDILDTPMQTLTSAPLLRDLSGGVLSPLADGPTCIAGCDDGDAPSRLDGGLRETLKGVSGMIAGGSNSGPVLGLRLGSGDGIGSGGGGRPGLVGGLIGGESANSGPAGSAGESSHQGGLVSSTLNNTGTLLGNTLGKLKNK
jgi:hypothetical protein